MTSAPLRTTEDLRMRAQECQRRHVATDLLGFSVETELAHPCVATGLWAARVFVSRHNLSVSRPWCYLVGSLLCRDNGTLVWN